MQKVNWTIFIIFIIFLSTLQAQTSPMVVSDGIETNSPLYYNHAPNIARSSDGVLSVVWKSAEKQIVYSEYDNTFGTWSPAVALSNAGDEANKAGIAADNNGNIFVTWQQRDTSDEDFAIYFIKKSAGAWSTPRNLTGNDAENEECGISVSDQGVVFVAWNTDAEPDSSEFVYCISSSDQGENWSNPAILSSADGIIGGTSTTSGRPMLAKATNGKMVCTWHEEPLDHPNRESFTNQFDGTNWLGESSFIYTADSANTMYPAIAVDSEDNIYLSTVSFTSIEELLFVKKSWNDAEWVVGSEEVLFADPQVTKPVMGIDANDNMYIAFRRDMAADTTYGLEEVAYMASSDLGNTWSEQTVLSRENHDAGYLTLAPNVRESGVDLLWRESATEFLDDADTTAVVYGHVDLLAVSVEQKGIGAPAIFELAQNYPNPFNPSTVINFSIPESGMVSLKVYNLLGQSVAELVNDVKAAGSYEVSFDASYLTTGIYMYKIQSGNFTATRKMLLVK